MTRYVKVRDIDSQGSSTTAWVPSSEVFTLTLETPTGDVDGVNDDYVFSSPPLAVFYQGVLQTLTVDYTLVGSTVTFTNPPVGGLVQGLVSA